MTDKAKGAAKPAAKKAAKPVAKPARKRGLDKRERVFVDEYLLDLKPDRAALAAGYSVTVARTKAYQWVSNSQIKPHVHAAVALAMLKRGEKTAITAEKVLERLWMIATADPNEIVTHRRICCRYCFGEQHEYQWIDDDEFVRACRNAKAEDMKAPSNDGGYGFNDKLRPHPLCPVCKGEGYGSLMFGDTRDLSPAALALYAGAKKTKDGLELKTQNQLEALNMVARHLGMFNDKLTLKGDAENPLLLFMQQLAGKTLKPVPEGG